MYCKTMNQAREAAQSNANYFQCAYCVFFDTNGNARCEAYTTQHAPLTIYKPDPSYRGLVWTGGSHASI